MYDNQTINNKGLNGDLSKTSQAYGEFYLDALNMTLVFNENSSFFTLTNEKGNELVFTLPDSDLTSIDAAPSAATSINPDLQTRIRVRFSASTSQVPYYSERPIGDFNNGTDPFHTGLNIIGGCSGEKNTFYIATAWTNNPSDQNIGCIWKYTFSLPLVSTTIPELVYAGRLGWLRTTKLQMKYHYENENVKKLYLVDGINCLRFINVANDTLASTDPLHPLHYSLEEIDSTPEVWLPQPEITETLKGGNFSRGMVQYGYTLSSSNGVETKLSPLSFLCPVTNNNKGVTDTGTGDSSFRVELSSLNTNLDRIKLYRIHTNSTGVQTVNLILETTHQGAINIVDNGTLFVATSSLSEITNLGTNYFIPKTLEILESKLFLGNIEEEEIDLSAFDTRAYRFDSSGTPTCIIKDEDGNTEHTITSTGIAAATSNANHWPNANNNDNWDILDCINPSNIQYDPTQSDFAKYIFQSDGSTLGAEGPNVEISFGNGGTTYNAGYYGHLYKNREYKTGEIYRFGIRFITKRGSQSQVKWICDLKIPYARDIYSVLTSGVMALSGSGSRIFVPIFNIKNLDDLPENIQGYQIVRLERTSGDRTIIDQGVVNCSMYNSSRGTDSYDRIYTPHITMRNYSSDVGGSDEDDLDTLNELNAGSGQYITKGDALAAYCPSHLIQSKADILKATKVDLVAGNLANLTAYYKIADYNWGDNDDTVQYWGELGPYIVGGGDYEDIFTAGASTLTIYGGNLFADTNQGHDAMSRIYYHNSSYLSANAIGSPTNGATSGFRFNVSQLFNVGRGSATTTISSLGRSYRNYIYCVGSYASSGPGTAENSIITSYHTKCFILDPSWTDLYTNSGTAASIPANTYAVMDFINENIGQYGGYSYGARKSNQYIPCGGVQKITSTSHSQAIFGGDTFKSKFNFLRLIPQINPSIDGGVAVTTSNAITNPSAGQKLVMGEYCELYVESFLNLDLRHDKLYKFPKTRDYLAYEDDDIYKYSSVYHLEDNALTFRSSSLYNNETNVFRSQIKYSDTKINNESVDSFGHFRILNFAECPSLGGSITKLVNFNNVLYTIQEHSIGYWLVDPLAVTSSTAGPTSLGTGLTMQKYIPVDTVNGSTHINGVIAGERGLYVMDTYTKRFCRIKSGKELPISESKGIFNKLNTEFPYHIDTLSVSMGYNPKTYSVYCTIQDENLYADPEYNSLTFSFNEMTDSIVSYHNYYPSVYINTKEAFFSIYNEDVLLSTKVYLHNYSNNTRFYGTKYPFYASWVVNKNSNLNKLYSHFEYKLEVTDSAQNPQLDENLDVYSITSEGKDSSFLTTSDTRKVRKNNVKWKLQFGRDINSRNSLARVNGNWAVVTLKHNNTTEDEYQYMLYSPTIHFKYLNS